MNNTTCINCGYSYEYIDGKWKCPACGAYKPEEITNEEVTLLYGASQKLRINAFEDAEALYYDITRKYPKNSQGFWGLCLSKYGIKYEQDYDGKMIPTCYATSYDSLLEDRNFKKAVSLAGKEDAEFYREQANKIENIRREWINKASKQKPYDVFISYKDSDLEAGIERTEDSRDAFELYTHLKELGYNVFYSRESLKDKTGEKFEPYIFSALNTAKVMIVFGSKPEYIESTWLRNEWSRFIKKIKEGQKQPNSLVVVYKGFNPSKLPSVLSSMQCMNAKDMKFLFELDAHIARVVKSSASSGLHIERVSVKGRAKKASGKIKLDTVEVVDIRAHASEVHELKKAEKKQLGKYQVEKLNPEEEEKLRLANTYLKAKRFDTAKSIYDQLLSSNPRNAGALLGKMMLSSNCSNLEEFLKTGATTFEEYGLVAQVLESLDLKSAQKILSVICDCVRECIDQHEISKAKDWMQQICAYDSEHVQKLREECFNRGLERISKGDLDWKFFVDVAISYEGDFKTFVSMLHSVVDRCLGDSNYQLAKEYTARLVEYDGENFLSQINHLQATYAIKNSATALSKIDLQNGDLEKILNALNESSIGEFLTLCYKVIDDLQAFSKYDECFLWLEKISKYNFEKREEILNNLIDKCTKTARKENAKYFEELLILVANGDQERYKKEILTYALGLRRSGNFELAKEFYEKIIYIEGDNIQALWGVFYAKLACRSDKDLCIHIHELTDFTPIEELLSVRADQSAQIIDRLINSAHESFKVMASNRQLDKHVSLFKVVEKLFAYIPEYENATLAKHLLTLANNCKEKRLFDYAEKYYAMLVEIQHSSHEGYWGLLLSKLKCATDEEVIKCDISIGNYTEFENALLASSKQGIDPIRYIEVQKKQEEYRDSLKVTEQKQKVHKKQQKRAKTKKAIAKLVSLILVAVILVVAGSVALAYYNKNSVLVYQEVEGGYAVSAGALYSAKKGELVIPSTYEGKNVIRINTEAFKNNKSITSVTIPSTVTGVGQNAFEGCYNIENVRFNGNLEQWCDITFESIDSNPTSFSRKLYIGNKLLTSELVIPQSITQISPYAFSGLSSLNSVTIHENVTVIGEKAFADCLGITSITLPFVGEKIYQTGNGENANATLKYIFGEHSAPTALSNITITSAVQIAPKAFEVCASSLKEVNILGNLTFVAQNAFLNCYSLESVTIPASAQVSDNAFSGCVALKKMSLPAPTTTFKALFNNSVPSTLKEVEIVSGIIADKAFKDLASLTKVILSSTVSEIGEQAFDGCTSLNYIYIPSTVQVIKKYAFINCVNLTIYCQAEGPLSGWATDWNWENCAVLWNQTNN